jgi:hypothetical protein
MTPSERLQKAIHRIDSALLHMEAVQSDVHDDDVDIIIGHLKRAQEKLHVLNYAHHHPGKKVVQQELF